MGDDKTRMQEYAKRKKEECLGSVWDVGVEGGGFCETVFDGFLCWKRTEAGSVAMQGCPNDDFLYSSIKVSWWVEK